MAPGSHASVRGYSSTAAVLRPGVAALATLHMVLVVSQFDRAGLLVPAAVATGLFVFSAAVGLLAPRAGHVPPRPLAATLALVDLVSLVAIARLTVEVDPAASIVWSFVLWVPFSVALAARATWGAFATASAALAVLGANLMATGPLSTVPRDWTTLGVPSLLVLVGGGAILVASLAQRRGTAGVRRQLLDERVRSSRLREADELKNTFLAAVSHELRSPLTSILGFSLTLLDHQDLDAAQRDRMLRTIVLEAEHLEDILANLLDLDRLTRGKATLVPVELDPARVIATAVDHACRRSGREVHLELAEDVRAWLDAAKVERIVENLVGNALKYTPAGADVRVAMQRDRHGIRIRVDDSGPGIGSDLRESIFEPFRRGGDHGVPGTGIGLSLVDQFSRMHGGKAWLEDRPGGGCRFQVYLPSVGGPVRSVASAERPIASDAHGQVAVASD